MLGSNFDNRFLKIKVLGVNTAEDGEISGGLAALNRMVEKNLAGVKYLAVDRHDIYNLVACKAAHKFRLLDMADERTLVRCLRGTDLILVLVDEVWENIKAVSIATHCVKKAGVPMILIAGGNFLDAEDEIIFDAVVKLPSENFEFDAANIAENFIEAVTLPGYPKLDMKTLADFVKDSAAVVGYGEGRNSVVIAAKHAISHVKESVENFKATKKILFNVTAPKEKFSLSEAQKLSSLFESQAPDAEISFGFSTNDWLAGKTKFLLIAAQ